MKSALFELIDKVNQTGRAVLVVELAPPQEHETAAQQDERLAAYLVRGGWVPPGPTSPTLSITGQVLLPNMLALLERTRLGSQAAQNELEQALLVLPMRRRQYSADHRFVLYDGHPAQPQGY